MHSIVSLNCFFRFGNFIVVDDISHTLMHHMHTHTHTITVAAIGIDWLIASVIIHGLLHFSGLYQFIDVIECGEHSRLIGIGETGTFFINIMAALSILSVSCSTHIFKESQYLNVIRCWFPQFVQFSAKQNKKRSSEKKNERIN